MLFNPEQVHISAQVVSNLLRVEIVLQGRLCPGAGPRRPLHLGGCHAPFGQPVGYKCSAPFAFHDASVVSVRTVDSCVVGEGGVVSDQHLICLRCSVTRPHIYATLSEQPGAEFIFKNNSTIATDRSN